LFGQTLLERIGVDAARIEFDGPVTQEELEKLIALIKLNADVFLQKAEQYLTCTMKCRNSLMLN